MPILTCHRLGTCYRCDWSLFRYIQKFILSYEEGGGGGSERLDMGLDLSVLIVQGIKPICSLLLLAAVTSSIM